MAEVDECLRVSAVIGEKIAGTVTGVPENHYFCSSIFENDIRKFSGPELEPFRKLESDRGEAPAADPAFDCVNL